MNAPISSLTVHPLLQAIRIPEENNPESKVVVASVGEVGILEALKVSKGRVVDGRLRLRGAIAAGLDAVPVVEVAEEDIASIILHSLAARRHYTKSALAYLGFPIMEAALAESRRRRLENIRKFQSGASASKIPQVRTGGDTADALAENLGIARSFFFYAQAIHKKFAANPKSIREQWEPRILSGEMSLREVQQALAGKLAAINGQTTPKCDAQQLLFDLFNAATVRFGRWDTLSTSQQEKIAEKFRAEFLPSLPPELLEEARNFRGVTAGN